MEKDNEMTKEAAIEAMEQGGYKVIEEYRRRHPEEFKEKEDNNGKEI